MTLVRGFTITIASGLTFGLLGGALGYAIALFAPDYYRLVFRIPPSVQFDPVHLGMGLGLTQGLAAGLLIGLVIVVTVAWYNSRLTERAT